jgi:hypothetical protein
MMRRHIQFRRPNHATVAAYLALFIALGGASYAALQLPKNSVGQKQLKKNAVTTAKLKKNAVTAAKIKKGSINGAKVKDNSLTGGEVQDRSLTGSDVNRSSMPFAQVVHKARGNATLPLTTKPQVYPLDSPTYTQAANEVDGYSGAVDVTISSTCAPPRIVTAQVLVDAADPTTPKPQDVASAGSFVDNTSTNLTGRVEIGGGASGVGRFEPGASKSRTLSLIITGFCNAGSGITATFGGVDVIGTTS